MDPADPGSKRARHSKKKPLSRGRAAKKGNGSQPRKKAAFASQSLTTKIGGRKRRRGQRDKKQSLRQNDLPESKLLEKDAKNGTRPLFGRKREKMQLS